MIILTTFDLDHYVYAALAAGASGFLLKDVTPEHLAAAVRMVRAGDALLAPAITRRLVERFARRDAGAVAVHRDLSSLTPRELEVLGLLAQGRSNAELAAGLQLSEATVKTHVARILGKLGLRDRAQAVVAAYESGLVVPAGTGARSASSVGSRLDGRRTRRKGVRADEAAGTHRPLPGRWRRPRGHAPLSHQPRWIRSPLRSSAVQIGRHTDRSTCRSGRAGRPLRSVDLRSDRRPCRSSAAQAGRSLPTGWCPTAAVACQACPSTSSGRRTAWQSSGSPVGTAQRTAQPARPMGRPGTAEAREPPAG